jgi:hypothetical protein
LARLPNAEQAIIEAGKLQDYILSSVHPVGRFKAAFFQRLGYSIGNWEIFEQRLRELVLSEDVTKVEDTRYGQKFIVEGLLDSLTGEKVQIVTVWVILKGEKIPRFIT